MIDLTSITNLSSMHIISHNFKHNTTDGLSREQAKVLRIEPLGWGFGSIELVDKGTAQPSVDTPDT